MQPIAKKCICARRSRQCRAIFLFAHLKNAYGRLIELNVCTSPRTKFICVAKFVQSQSLNGNKKVKQYKYIFNVKKKEEKRQQTMPAKQ